MLLYTVPGILWYEVILGYPTQDILSEKLLADGLFLLNSSKLLLSTSGISFSGFSSACFFFFFLLLLLHSNEGNIGGLDIIFFHSLLFCEDSLIFDKHLAHQWGE